MAAPSIAQAESSESFETYAKEWLRTASLNLKSSTIRFYTDALDNHIFKALGAKPVAQIDRQDCRQLGDPAGRRGIDDSSPEVAGR